MSQRSGLSNVLAPVQFR